MKKRRKFRRAIQYFSAEQLRQGKKLTAKQKLEWLANAQKLLYLVYRSSGNRKPYDPQRWSYSA